VGLSSTHSNGAPFLLDNGATALHHNGEQVIDEGSGEIEVDEEVDPLLDEIIADVEHMTQNDPGLIQTPTLEEILSETDNLDASAWRAGGGNPDDISIISTPKKQYAIPAGGIDSDIGDTLSVSSFGSRGTRASRASGRGESGRLHYGSIFRHLILKGVSAQMTSAADRVKAGAPTCMTASCTAVFIAVGTQNSHILVFDSNQVIKWFLGGPSIAMSYGAVSCLAFCLDATKLLVGFARGQVVEYDMATGKILRDMSDVHPIGSSITHVRYSENPNIAFISDSGGSVFKLSMTRGIRGAGATTRCIFSGSRGEVCTMEPLYVAHKIPEHPLTRYSILALATITRIIVITVKPRLKVLMTAPLLGDQHTLPLLCWQFVLIQNQFSHKTNDPVLTFARGSTISFYQVSVNLSYKIVFIPLQSVDLNFTLSFLSWMNNRYLGLLDQSEQLHLMDARTKDILETVDLKKVEIVYQTQFFKGLANGGNVSAAFSLAGETAVYGSLCTFTNQILVLGKKTFHALIIRTWSERLDHLLKDNRFIEALNLGLDMYDDPGKALVGLRGPRDRKRAHISLRVMGILKKFLDVSMTKNFPEEGGMATLTKYFNEIVPPSIDVCIRLGKTDFLFEKVWNTFNEDPFSCAAFLESLEPYLLSDQLPVIPTQIVQRFVDHYEKREKFEPLEACITHLSIICLDIHQVMVVSEKHRLYDAIIYVFNNAMLDYISPAEKLLSEVKNALASDKPFTQEQIDIGNKLLVYVSGCLAGRAYPYGDVPQDRVKQVKYDIYSTITLIHSRKITPESEHEPPYPHLNTLLAFDTQGFLNVLSIAFEEKEYQTEIGNSQKQRLVDLLLQVMLKEDSTFSPAQVGYLFTFLARQIAKGDRSVSISRDLFSRVLSVLTDPEQPGSREEREDSLLDMLEYGGWHLFEPQHLEDASIGIGFYRVLRMVYSSRQEYVKLFHCYVKDQRRNQQTFHFIQTIFSSDDKYTGDVRRLIGEEMVASVGELAAIDVRKTAVVVYQYLAARIPDILSNLSSQPVYYEFLQELLEQRGSSEGLGSPTHQMNVRQVFTADLYEQYIQLMCTKDPTAVLEYVKTKETYRVDSVLELCKKYNITDARIYLLETLDRYTDAFAILADLLSDKVAQCMALEAENNGNIVENGGDNENIGGMNNNLTAMMDLRIAGVNTQLLVVTQFLQRCSDKLSEESREELWCSLLDKVSAPIKTVHNPEPWRSMVRHIVSTMLGHVGHKKVVSLVLSNPSCSSGVDTWAHLKHMLGELIQSFRYEERVLESSIQVQEKERIILMRELLLSKKRALHTNGRRRCSICALPLNTRVRSVVYTCGHAAHVDCADRCGGVTLDNTGTEVWSCTLCHPVMALQVQQDSNLNLQQRGATRVIVTGKEANTQQLTESLRQSLATWKLANETVDYSQLQEFEKEEGFEGRGFLDSDGFKLKLRPPNYTDS